jgi:hypothetical protein
MAFIVDEMGLLEVAKLRGKISRCRRKSPTDLHLRVVIRQGYMVRNESVDRMDPFPFIAGGGQRG